MHALRRQLGGGLLCHSLPPARRRGHPRVQLSGLRSTGGQQGMFRGHSLLGGRRLLAHSMRLLGSRRHLAFLGLVVPCGLGACPPGAPASPPGQQGRLAQVSGPARLLLPQGRLEEGQSLVLRLAVPLQARACASARRAQTCHGVAAHMLGVPTALPSAGLAPPR